MNRAAIKFQNEFHRASVADDNFRMRDSVFINVDDDDSAVYEKYVKQYEDIFHPYRHIALFTESEKHAIFGCHRSSEHQALLALDVIERQLRSEMIDFPRAAFDG